MLTFIRDHWRRVAILCALLGVMFAAGRCSVSDVPARVEVREVERIVYQDRIVERVVEVKIREAAEARRVVVYRDRVIQPDGTRHEREVERTVTESATREEAATDSQRVETREVVREVERRVEVEAERPRWRLGGLAGVDVRTPGPAFGAALERRVLGPVSVGAWGLHTGQAGVSVSVEF